MKEQTMCQQKYVVAALLGGALLGAPLVMSAQSQWLLMSRHGECHEIETLKRKVPELADIRDPQTFIALMRQQGHEVTTREANSERGKAVVVKVPARELGLIFATRELCERVKAEDR